MATTSSPNGYLSKPDYNEQDWHNDLNNNFDIIDGYLMDAPAGATVAGSLIFTDSRIHTSTSAPSSGDGSNGDFWYVLHS